ncbi:LutC/YkgG family protein [Candidatus Spongiihabitans sp.]|uniref:LutC/YkgG family protein n=1 Tax=Candidatus Spongiihabitans sp. TaxID=3101308 RepID=UPI003C70425E
MSKIREATGSLDAGSLDFGPAPDFSIKLPQPDYQFDIESNKTEASKTDQFIAMLAQVHGTWEILENLGDVPVSVANYLIKAGTELRAVIATDEKLTQLDWGDMVVESRAAKKSDCASITMAFAGIAETGTIAMVSSAQSPITLNFLPEINIVVLMESRLAATMEQFWPRIKAQPRAINFITGPSKTADIEQTLVYGAHGPRHFHVIIVKNPRQSNSSDSDSRFMRHDNRKGL